jgi:vancomycin resistance protein VanJ
VAGLGAVGLGALVARRAGGRPRTAAVGAPADLTVHVHNVLATNRHIALIAGSVADHGAEIAVLVEVRAGHVRALERALPGWHIASKASSGFLGVCVASRWPIERVEAFRTGYLAGVAVETGGVTVAAIHLPSPVWPPHGAIRNQGMAAAEAAAALAAVTGPLIIAGDLNATRWNRPYRTIKGDLTDAVRTVSRDWFLTYPTRAPVVRIDHCFVRDLEPVSARRLPPAGSDHHPLLLGLRRMTPGPGPP